MDVVNAWCKGGSFAKIVELTDVYEGSIIRAMRRLEELLRDMCHAAKGMCDYCIVKYNSKFRCWISP